MVILSSAVGVMDSEAAGEAVVVVTLVAAGETGTGEVVILFLASRSSRAWSSFKLSLLETALGFLSLILLEQLEEASDPLSFSVVAFFLTAALATSLVAF